MGRPGRAVMRVLRALVLLLLLCPVWGAARAQLAPNLNWRTIRTRHFLVHFTPPLEAQARRAAANAEQAYAELATELTAPRGPIDLVLSDDVDFTNGYATPFPSNRIVLYANPPVNESALRFTDDWDEMGITHELTHILHLDRSRGIWSLGQHLFGRAPVLFPNEYAPSWLLEGLAVYYETRFTGAGRLAGSEHPMIARAAAVSHSFPTIGQVSLATPVFPFGESAYAYGSLFVDQLAHTYGPEAIHAFVENESGEVIPYLLDIPSRRAFGVSFSTAWRRWSDSLVRAETGLQGVPPLTDWHPLTTDAVFVDFPRWVDDTAILYSGAPGRQSYGAYRIDMAGREERVGRRNSRTPNLLRPDGSILFSQLEFVNPYQERSDLFLQRGRTEARLTRGARLSDPDVRADGAIVAIQTMPASTRLVRLAPNGSALRALTGARIDEQWTEPRWSHAGDRIAVVHWRRGGISEIQVVDTVGAVLRTLASGHSVQATPSWSPDDRVLFYASDHSGRTELYYFPLQPLAGESAREYRVSNAVTGLFAPQMANAQPGASAPQNRLAAVQFRAQGFQLGVGACCDVRRPPLSDSTVPYPMTGTRPEGPVLVDTTPATSYRMWHSLRPHYWMPVLETGLTDRSLRVGVQTSGSDAVNRHTYAADVELPTDNSGVTGSFAYGYAGLGLPVLSLSGYQLWEQYGTVLSRTQPHVAVGVIRRRTDDGEADATWIRHRVRSITIASFGIGADQRGYAGVPAGIVRDIDTMGIYRAANFPRVQASIAFNNAQQPAFSISPEDGVTFGATVREGFTSAFDGSGPPSSSAVAAATAYKSLDLRGFGHHVIALRLAAGAEDERGDTYLEAGGVSGSTFQLLPGYTIGQGSQTFGVRGFNSSSVYGTRALAASLEYRAPLFMPGSGIGLLPFFFDRTAIALFGDAATAWCPDVAPYSLDRQICTSNEQQLVSHSLTTRNVIASVGAELNLTAAVFSWDTPYRFRWGVAVPVRNAQEFAASRVSTYVAIGLSF